MGRIFFGTIAAVLCAMGGSSARAQPIPPQYDDPAYCARTLATAAEHPLSDAAHRRCMIAIAGAYLDAEANPALAAKLPIAEDASRHVLGRTATPDAGGRSAVLAGLDQSTVASIENRRWSVEGDVAYVVYDGALRTNPKRTPYAFAERITIEKGMIKDIVLLAASGVH